MMTTTLSRLEKKLGDRTRQTSTAIKRSVIRFYFLPGHDGPLRNVIVNALSVCLLGFFSAWFPSEWRYIQSTFDVFFSLLRFEMPRFRFVDPFILIIE